MIKFVPSALVVLAVVVAGCAPSASQADAPVASDRQRQAPPNTLSEQERAEGWRLLFDGATLAGWRGYRRDAAPDSWQVSDGILRFAPEGERGEIITVDQFENFELRLEWRISENGNSGIFFRASEAPDRVWEGAPEMQLLHTEGHPDGKNPLTSAVSNYALHGPSADVTRPVGSWNEVWLVVDGARVEHWLNQQKIVEYELWTDEWQSMVAASKFNEWPAYGQARRGHIGLQDHGDEVWYRNIKIRPLPPTS